MKVSEILLSKRNLNLPNILSIIRILMVGVLILFFKLEMHVAAFLTYVTASATDVLDGYIARKYDLITHLGKLLDPLADKMMLVTVLACMHFAGVLPLWILIVIVVKELVQIIGGFFMYHKRDTVVQSNIFGKLTTIFFAFSVVLLFWHEYVAPYDKYALIFTVVFAVYALVQYMVKYTQTDSETKDITPLEDAYDQQTN